MIDSVRFRSVSDAQQLLAVGRSGTPKTAPPVSCSTGMLEASRDAGLLVVGLSTRWHQEGLGEARLTLAREATPPTLLVRRGLRPGGLAPPAALPANQ
jgi:hypothetical protein